MTRTLKDLLAGIHELAPRITARAAEIEAARRIPPDLVEALRSIGVFRMMVPQSHGGMELDLPAVLEVVATLARIDGSVGWAVMIATVGPIFLSMLPRQSYERVYQGGPDVIAAGSAQPGGTAEAVPGGWRVNGRWPFASGCQHADWMLGLCIMSDDGKPLPGPTGEAGPPLALACCLPAREWQIEDTWHVVGLKGTGSHHIALRDALVPAQYFVDLSGGASCLPGPLYQTPMQIIPLLHAAFAVGVAEAALSELLEVANSGQRQLHAAVPMRESESFQVELGRAAADVRAAAGFLQAQAASHWQHTIAGALKDEAFSSQATQTAIWLTATCVRAVDACFTLAGSAAVYNTSALQRRLRDIHVAAQHGAVQQRHYVTAGRQLLGVSQSARA
jgi:alkylation response protein AidB-like acyl-CoA dehydrogenase